MKTSDSEQVQPNRCRKWKVWVNDYNDIALEPSDSEHRKEIVVTELSAEHQADERVEHAPECLFHSTKEIGDCDCGLNLSGAMATTSTGVPETQVSLVATPSSEVDSLPARQSGSGDKDTQRLDWLDGFPIERVGAVLMKIERNNMAGTPRSAREAIDKAMARAPKGNTR
jgi:hypothetical protein